MDVSLLKLKSMFRHAGGRKGTLLAQALRKQDARQDAAVVTNPRNRRHSELVSRYEFGSARSHRPDEADFRLTSTRPVLLHSAHGKT